jgi:hypothetical protein
LGNQRNAKKYKKLEVKCWIKTNKAAYKRHKIYNYMAKDQKASAKEDRF